VTGAGGSSSRATRRPRPGLPQLKSANRSAAVVLLDVSLPSYAVGRCLWAIAESGASHWTSVGLEWGMLRMIGEEESESGRPLHGFGLCESRLLSHSSRVRLRRQRAPVLPALGFFEHPASSPPPPLSADDP